MKIYELTVPLARRGLIEKKGDFTVSRVYEMFCTQANPKKIGPPSKLSQLGELQLTINGQKCKTCKNILSTYIRTFLRTSKPITCCLIYVLSSELRNQLRVVLYTYFPQNVETKYVLSYIRTFLRTSKPITCSLIYVLSSERRNQVRERKILRTLTSKNYGQRKWRRHQSVCRITRRYFFTSTIVKKLYEKYIILN